MNEISKFSDVLRIVARGPTLSRPLEADEAEEAMTQILSGRADELQTGGFLLVLRGRGETGAELAGFVRAAKRRQAIDCSGLAVDLDWPSYADRHRQQPWFVLAALLLAQQGIRVLMHGVAGAMDAKHASVRPVLTALGLGIARDRASVQRDLDQRSLAYVGIEDMAPEVQRLLDFRPRLGVRTAVNSFSRALNPGDAPVQLQGVFHPPYKTMHRDAAVILGQPRAAIFKGGGGEAQRAPTKPCSVLTVRDGEVADEIWPALLPGQIVDWRAEDLSPQRIAALWRGELDYPPAVAMITGTAAIALYLLGQAATIVAADAQAAELWQGRQRLL